jgi:hypothetical protein
LCDGEGEWRREGGTLHIFYNVFTVSGITLQIGFVGAAYIFLASTLITSNFGKMTAVNLFP